jgi:hypothetical protein
MFLFYKGGIPREWDIDFFIQVVFRTNMLMLQANNPEYSTE